MVRGFRRRGRTKPLPSSTTELHLGTGAAREDLSVLADRIDGCPPWSDGQASGEWKLSVGLYAAGRVALREVVDLDDLRALQITLREAWFHLARAEALAFGHDPPTSSSPCFFNTQHGPAVTEVEWAPLGEEPGPVDACRADAERIAAGFAPQLRRPQPTAFIDQADNSPVQRVVEMYARGGGGYAQGMLNAGRSYLWRI